MKSFLLNQYVRSLSADERKIWADGFRHCLYLFAVWRNGIEIVGCASPRMQVLEELENDLRSIDESEENKNMDYKR